MNESILFILLFGLFIGSELATLAFYSPLFRLGVPIYASQPSIQPPIISEDALHTTEHWVFKVVAPDMVLVRPRMRYFGFRVQGVVGTLSWAGGRPTLKFRMQISMVVFMVVWLSMWLYGSVAIAMREGAIGDSLAPGALGLIMFALVLCFTIGFARSCIPEFMTAYATSFTDTRLTSVSSGSAP